ncbi:LCP family protein [Streptomyces sp. NPDC002889]|uniref:LCP family protein n=1 Tax=Streptomyces sp. NPDC002889 TaxID=3364669 RepID=UPI0036C9603E
MDAHVTDSAGTPAEPDGPADDEAAADDSAATGAAADPGTRTNADADPDAGSDAESHTATGTNTDAGTDADTEGTSGAGTGSGPGTGTDRHTAPDSEGDSGTHGGSGSDAGPGVRAGPDAGTAPDSDAGPGVGTATGSGVAGAHVGARVGEEPKHRRHLLRWTALGTSVVLLAAAGTGWWFYRKLDANITTDTSAAAELETYEEERPEPVAVDALNVLLLGSDTRSGEGNDAYGSDGGDSQRSDTTILLHIAADRQSATAMSIPRDLMVTIPSCGKPDGSRTQEQFAQFNWAFQFGGAACTIRTVEQFTGIRIDHHMVIDFRGFKDMVDAVDGVEVCLTEPINDKAAHLTLRSGRQTLDGEQSLGFVRARKSLGNGSDTERMERQQQFLGALVKKVQSNGVLLNPTRLYPVLDAATKSITTDPGLDSLRDLYDLTRSIRNVPTEKVQFLTVPRQPYAANPNRDELVEPDAGDLFERLRDDAPVIVVPEGKNAEAKQQEKERERSDGKPDDTSSRSPAPTATFSGTNAAEGMCE